MGEGTKIEWATDTFNPWVGCEKVSPACKHCYAEGWAKRTGNPQLWRGDRRVTSDANWRKPIKWNSDAERTGEQRRVFCASLADVFEDRDDLVEPRKRLWELIESTPALNWLLLTKRPENVNGMAPEGLLAKLWIGTTAENQEWADKRVCELLEIECAVRFLSCEPLLGETNLERYLWFVGPSTAGPFTDWADRRRLLNGKGQMLPQGGPGGQAFTSIPSHEIDWVIAGGESGPGARPMHPDWVRSLRDQCVDAGVPFHFKQWGEWFPDQKGIYEGARTAFLSDVAVHRIGKKAAGRELDGREWNELPEVSR